MFFFLVSSLALIGNRRITDKKIIFSLILLNIAHGIRYESWMMLPLIWFLIIDKRIKLKMRVIYILGSLLFPLYWVFVDFQYSGRFLNFIREKSQFANTSSIAEYSNLWISFQSWIKKLFFSPSMAIICYICI